MSPISHIETEFTEQSKLEGDVTSSTSLRADLLSHARLLLMELEAFQSYVQSQKIEDAVDISKFCSGVLAETKSLERIAVLDDPPILESVNKENETRRLHVLRSSNLPFYDAVWAAAGECQGVIALGKRVHFEQPAKNQKITPDQHPQRQPPSAHKPRVCKQKVNLVVADIIADDGGTWIKVSTITEKRLILEMAKEGWEGYDGDSSEDDTGSAVENERLSEATDHGNRGLELVRLAEEMKTAASAVRVRYRHPRLKFILTKIHEGRLPEIDAVIDDLRKTGAEVYCAAELRCGLDGPTIDSSGPPGKFARMLPRAHRHLTPSLNIDCTILLALISDISHLRLKNLPAAPNGKYHSAIIRQIQSEETTLLLHSELYPLLVGRQLRCTSHAARRMKEIVETMGTPAEKTRADIILGEGANIELSEIDLRKELERFSNHDVPSDLRLPLTIVEVDGDTILAGGGSSFTTKMMADVAEGLSEINRSVFLYGWAQKLVTISSNMAVAKEIDRRVCQLLDKRENGQEADVLSDDATGPDICVCRTARSLIGKEKAVLATSSSHRIDGADAMTMTPASSDAMRM